MANNAPSPAPTTASTDNAVAGVDEDIQIVEPYATKRAVRVPSIIFLSLGTNIFRLLGR
jgi:hypothetical protein